MNQADRDRLVSLKKAKKKLITQKEAAAELGITERQVRRLLSKLKKRGDKAVVHALRGQPSNRKIDEKVQQQAVEILSQPAYRGFRPTLASEHLGKHHKLEASRETVRHWMMQAKLWKPRRQSVEKVHMWRERRSRWGELVQWDTSDHDWLEGRGKRLKLIAMIDDASSRYLAHFVNSDSTEENMAVLEQYLNQHGRPLAFYTDKASLFQTAVKTKRGEQREGKDQPEMAPTQIGRALRELGIPWIAAHSPQAKGRVERSFGTAQDRLVKELRVAGANTLEQANEYLQQEFIPWWNETLTVTPASADDAHRPLGQQHDLGAILSHVENRRVHNDYTIHFASKVYQIDRKEICAGLRGAQVRVEQRRDGSLALRFRERYLPVSLCEPRPKVAQPKPRKERLVARPRKASNWNKNFDLKNAPKLWQAAQGSGAKPQESW
jgi:transposase